MFIDISKAYLHADVLNDSICVELPGEMNMPNMCGRLLRALYGIRQAARAWEEEYTKTLKGVVFQKGKCNPCMYYHPRRDVGVLVHGDDFTVAFNDSELKYVAEVFQNKYKTKVRRILGSDLHDMKAMTILNRIVEWTNAGIQCEADPRHVDQIVEELELENANGSDVTQLIPLICCSVTASISPQQDSEPAELESSSSRSAQPALSGSAFPGAIRARSDAGTVLSGSSARLKVGRLAGTVDPVGFTCHSVESNCVSNGPGWLASTTLTHCSDRTV